MVSGSPGTGDPRPLQATVAVRDFVQVLLVVILSVVEGLGLRDLRGDGSEPVLRQNLEGQQRNVNLYNLD